MNLFFRTIAIRHNCVIPTFSNPNPSVGFSHELMLSFGSLLSFSLCFFQWILLKVGCTVMCLEFSLQLSVALLFLIFIPGSCSHMCLTNIPLTLRSGHISKGSHLSQCEIQIIRIKKYLLIVVAIYNYHSGRRSFS